MNKFDEATEALYSGDAETASRLLAEGAAEAVDPRAIAQQVRYQLVQDAEQERALAKLYTDYPEIGQDSDLAFVADLVRARLEAEGLSRSEAIAAAGEETGRKLRLGKWNPEAAPTPQSDASSNASLIIERMRRSRAGAP
jgi:hypothetical protein